MRVYRLVAIEIGGALADGAYEAHETALGVFSSVSKAEAMIRIHKERSAENGIPVLGYVLYENALDDLSLHGPWKCVPQFLSVRTYLADGRLNASCECDDACEQKWHGRDASTIRFKCGDSVMVWDSGRIIPMLVGKTPVTNEAQFVGDWSDDCYLAYPVEGGHAHPFVPYVFPFAGFRQLSARTEQKLRLVRDREESLSSRSARRGAGFRIHSSRPLGRRCCDGDTGDVQGNFLESTNKPNKEKQTKQHG